MKAGPLFVAPQAKREKEKDLNYTQAVHINKKLSVECHSGFSRMVLTMTGLILG